jgi:hypothetical protein
MWTLKYTMWSVDWIQVAFYNMTVGLQIKNKELLVQGSICQHSTAWRYLLHSIITEVSEMFKIQK